MPDVICRCALPGAGPNQEDHDRGQPTMALFAPDVPAATVDQVPARSLEVE